MIFSNVSGNTLPSLARTRKSYSHLGRNGTMQMHDDVKRAGGMGGSRDFSRVPLNILPSALIIYRRERVVISSNAALYILPSAIHTHEEGGPGRVVIFEHRSRYILPTAFAVSRTLAVLESSRETTE